MMSLYDAYEKIDASLVEINPFLLTKDNRLIALDAKVSFDDNGMFRHKEFEELRDLNEEEPLEIEASKHDLNYIKLDGNIGCMVNGAGLAMATMDIIKLAGGEPANFLDVGGGASQERVEQAFKILLRRPERKSGSINIFGGIVRCDMVAKRVVAAAKNLGVSIRSSPGRRKQMSKKGAAYSSTQTSASSPPQVWPTRQPRQYRLQTLILVYFLPDGLAREGFLCVVVYSANNA